MSEARTGFDIGRGPGREPDRAGSGNASALLPVSVFADRSYVRAEMAEDVAATGCRLAQVGGLDLLFLADHSDVLLVDCPMDEDAWRIDLARLAIRAAARRAPLVVSTSMAALDSVFASLSGSDAQILVMPSRAERMIALARALPQAGNRVRELSDEDRLVLFRLTEQVGQIAQKLEQLSAGPGPAGREAVAFPFDEAREPLRSDDATDRLARTVRPSLPDPRLVRRIIRQRQLRTRFFEAELFADPAWDMLLDLTAARAEHVRVSITSLCIASGVPPTTALRWISQMTDAGLLQRAEDQADRRRAFLMLTDKAADAIARYFAELGPLAATLI